MDYITTSQQERTLPLCCQPACLAQGESDVGQTEDTVLSVLSSEKNPEQIARDRVRAQAAVIKGHLLACHTEA